VGFDGHILMGKPQGSATYLRNLLRELGSLRRSFSIVVYCPDVEHAKLAVGEGDIVYKETSAGSVDRILFDLPKRFREDGVDLGIFQYIAPPFMRTRSATVVHDILPITHPELFPARFRIPRQLLFRNSMSRADLVFTVSDFAAAEIRRTFPALASRVVVTPNGPSFPVEQLLSDRAIAPCKFGQFILTVGRIEKRKNVDLLVRSFRRANVKGVKLVIVGSPDLGFRWRVPEDPSIVHLTNVDQMQLLDLYRSAALFVYPSSAEGFGIPLLDALLAGAPTVSSNQTSLPEVSSGLAELFDPTAATSEDRLAAILRNHFEGIAICSANNADREALSVKYSWRRTAEKFVEAVERLSA